MTFQLEVNGVELLNNYLEKIIGGIRDLRRFFPDVEKQFEQMQQQWFSSQGRGSWQPLSPSYAMWKNINFPGQPLLVLSGDLRDSHFDSHSSSDMLTIKVDAPDYWIFHQFGTSKMPARPPFAIEQSVQEALGQTLAKAIVRFMSGI